MKRFSPAGRKAGAAACALLLAAALRAPDADAEARRPGRRVRPAAGSLVYSGRCAVPNLKMYATIFRNQVVAALGGESADLKVDVTLPDVQTVTRQITAERLPSFEPQVDTADPLGLRHRLVGSAAAKPFWIGCVIKVPATVVVRKRFPDERGWQTGRLVSQIYLRGTYL